MFLRMVKKLPQGDLAKQAYMLNKSRGGGGGSSWEAGKDLQEDDLT